MKSIAAVAALVLGVSAARAQVELKIHAPETAYLLFAPILIPVEISNLGGQPLRLETVGGKSWLRFLVMRGGQTAVMAVREFEQPPVTLEPGDTARFRFDLTPNYKIREMGTYQVQALVRMAGVAGDLVSKPVEFSVVTGEVMWSQIAGLREGGARKYSLISHFNGDRNEMFAQIEDQEKNVVFSCRSLGQFMSGERPDTRLEPGVGWHVILRSDPATFRYFQMDPGGGLKSQEDFTNVGSRPRLVLEGQRVVVAGGMNAKEAQGETISGTQPPELLRMDGPAGGGMATPSGG